VKGERVKGELGKVKKFLNEFKEFAIKGNMIDMAVGVIIGGAFSAFITSIVTNIATPLIGILIGVDFKEWAIVLPRLYGNAEPSTLGIGLFLNSIISFIIIALTVFLFVKALNAFRKKPPVPPPPPPEPTKEELLLAEIRDILKSNKES
jgi:large conductance mechanosensitive channel